MGSWVHRSMGSWALLVCACLTAMPAQAQERRKVYIDQDCAGPGGTDMQAILAILNAPDTDVLGIGVLTGDQWRDEEIQHTLRLLEIVLRDPVDGVVERRPAARRHLEPRRRRRLGGARHFEAAQTCAL